MLVPARVLGCLAFAAVSACVEEPAPRVANQAMAPGFGPAPTAPAWGGYGATLAPPPPPTFPVLAPSPVASAQPAASGAACLDSRRGSVHRFTGRLEMHPDGSGNVRLALERPVCFEGGEFSRGSTDAIVIQGDASAAASLLGRQVEARGVSVDAPPSGGRAYVFELGSVALTTAR